MKTNVKLCTGKGCKKKAIAKGYCGSHHRRYLRNKPIDDQPVRTYRSTDPEALKRPEDRIHTRVDDETAEALERMCQKNQISLYSATRVILEGWAKGMFTVDLKGA